MEWGRQLVRIDAPGVECCVISLHRFVEIVTRSDFMLDTKIGTTAEMKLTIIRAAIKGCINSVWLGLRNSG